MSRDVFFRRKYFSFRLYYNPQNLTFPWNLPWNTSKTEANSQWIGSLSAYGSNPPYIDRPLIPSLWNLYANLPFFHPATKMMQNVQTSKKKKDKREKLVVFMTGYSRLVTESVSLRPGLTWLTHRVSRPFARLLCRPHVLQMRWNKLKDGFYRQNPAYFPQIYPWIHDKCSSTSFKLYLSARFSDFLILPLQCFLWCLFFDNTGKNFGQVIY